jgi:hypothetical protein
MNEQAWPSYYRSSYAIHAREVKHCNTASLGCFKFDSLRKKYITAINPAHNKNSILLPGSNKI